MGEAAQSYWLEKYIEESVESVDAEVTYFTGTPDSETDEDWKFGSD